MAVNQYFSLFTTVLIQPIIKTSIPFLQVQASDPGVKTPGFFSVSRMVTEVTPYALINIR